MPNPSLLSEFIAKLQAAHAAGQKADRLEAKAIKAEFQRARQGAEPTSVVIQGPPGPIPSSPTSESIQRQEMPQAMRQGPTVIPAGAPPAPPAPITPRMAVEAGVPFGLGWKGTPDDIRRLSSDDAPANRAAGWLRDNWDRPIVSSEDVDQASQAVARGGRQ